MGLIQIIKSKHRSSEATKNSVRVAFPCVYGKGGKISGAAVIGHSLAISIGEIIASAMGLTEESHLVNIFFDDEVKRKIHVRIDHKNEEGFVCSRVGMNNYRFQLRWREFEPEKDEISTFVVKHKVTKKELILKW